VYVRYLKKGGGGRKKMGMTIRKELQNYSLVSRLQYGVIFFQSMQFLTTVS
jgi:hypothetical protein